MFERVLPPIQTYEARDGRSLCYRHYLAESDKVIILLHGISEDGQYLHPLAEFLSKNHLAQVVVPDLRGYGLHPVRRGDVEYIGQHDDDIEDLIKWIRPRLPSPHTLIMAGHSGGGANVIRLTTRRLAKEVNAYLLLAPAVHPKAPINHKKDPWSTIQLEMPRVVFLTILNAVGLRFLNKWIVMRNDKPIARRHGRETLELSYRLLMSRTPKAKFERNLRAMTQPTLVLIGEKEEVFIPGQYAPMFAEYNEAKVSMILDSDHDGILSNEGTFREVESWLRAL
ncbi:alpha/beta hydrolase [Cohnella cholangitidis]|uniref:Alpha/beta hydrolase n=1 Tax=Cohnella cholangitidis TaxID=2598458 RepID=A0A7G5C0Y1_9BACL|nr:alpha/beta fold hydrolase [Cohnella cholangitidis]QMV42865.1 alpha/beta hydrolase [Cohnella cholangitidis]